MEKIEVIHLSNKLVAWVEVKGLGAIGFISSLAHCLKSLAQAQAKKADICWRKQPSLIKRPDVNSAC